MPVRNWVNEQQEAVALLDGVVEEGPVDQYSYSLGYKAALTNLEEYLESEQYAQERKRVTLREVRDALFDHGHHG